MSDNTNNGFPVPEEPLTREEEYLSAIAGVTASTEIPEKPLTRVEAYLNKIVENGGGGGGGGTSDYSQLSNKPKINNVELDGNKSLADIGAQPTIDDSHKLSADNVDDTSTTNKFTTAAQLEEISTTKSVVADMVDGSFKNLIPVTRDDIKSYNSELTWNGYSATYQGLTYTLNADGTIRINGTIGSTREFLILSRTAERTIFSEAGEYEFYCNVPNSGQIFCGINRTIDGTGVRYGADDGEGLDFEVAQSDLNLPVGIWIGTYETGGQIDCTLKPMVCKKSVWDMSNKYEPYRPTYDNLTSQVETNQTNISSILDGTTLDSFGDVETALSGKQATLTTAQLAAVNSGIDSTKVAQIQTNENNILTLTPTVNQNISANASNTYTMISELTQNVERRIGSSAAINRITAYAQGSSSGIRGIIISRSNDVSNYDTVDNLLAKIEQESGIQGALSTNCIIYNGSNDTDIPVYIWIKTAATGTARTYSIKEILRA